MKKVLPFLLLASFAFANDFQTDPLSVNAEKVSVISSFDDKDFFTVYSPEGAPLWEVSFSSKVISWKLDSDRLFVFSKARTGKVYFLSCFEAQKGVLQWERPVFAPDNTTDPSAMEPPTDALP